MRLEREAVMRVLIADDHALFRDGLTSLLEARGVDVVGEARNGREAVELTRATRPDVVLMDLSMPEMDGLTATRVLSTELPEVNVVVLTASEEDSDLFEAIKSGARGFLPKDLQANQFFELLSGVTRGEPALTPGLARKLLTEFARPASPRQERSPDALTEREREVLELLVQGVTSNRELAERLFVSENTVKYHLRNILDKLHLQNRAQVIAYALRTGLVENQKPNPRGAPD
jgi:DNA-binding NarL/FixJ family response regulator